MHLPTVAELNAEPDENVCLLLLRIMNTSDMTWMYDLFEPDTLEDIVNTCNGLRETCEELAEEPLTEEFKTEWEEHVRLLNDAITVARHYRQPAVTTEFDGVIDMIQEAEKEDPDIIDGRKAF